jgi:glycosyltransferase involved in cell wall biosynthesis
MKLLIISAGVLPLPVTQGGAVETLTEYLINENEIKHDFDITVTSIYNKASEMKSKNYKYCNFLYIKRNNHIVYFLDIISMLMYKLLKNNISSRLDYVIKLKQKLKEESYDKILIENDSYYVNVVNKYQKENIYLHIHNNYLNASIKNAATIYNSCNKVITISEFIQKCVLSIQGSNKEKVPVLRNCTNTTIFNKNLYINEREALRHQLGISKDDVVFLFSGRISKTKGIKELCLALQSVTNNNVKLLILGSAWYGNNKKDKFVKELEQITAKDINRIIFTGFINRDEVPKYHAISDVAVIPSIWEEPAGLVVIEAMSSGLPVIVTNSGGIPEFVNDEVAVLINKEKDLVNSLTKAIKKMAENPSLRREMGEKAKDWSKQYNIKNYYDEFCNIIIGKEYINDSTQG